MKYYVDDQGKYLGGWTENNPNLPNGAIEVQNPPEHGRQIWDGNSWQWPKDELKAYLADYRYEKEVSGILLSGIPVPTDDRSKSLITGAYNKALQENDVNLSKTFKINGSFITLTNGQIIAIALAVASHVQKCFDCEAIVYEGIEAETLTTKEQIATDFDNAYAQE